MIVAGMVALLLGGGAFFLSSGDSKAKKRQDALQQKSGVKARDLGQEKIARRKQVAESLKDIEKRRGQTRPSLDARIAQAGLTITTQQFLLISVGIGIGFGIFVYLSSGSVYFAGPSAFIGLVGIPNFGLAQLRKRRINRFVTEFPNAIDIIVRGVKAGLPLGDCIRIIASEASEPVRGEFRMIVETQAMGLSLGESVDRMAQRVPVTESNFFAIVINIQGKAGGNLSEALGNLSRVLRERKKMKGKIGAMSQEAKASAAIIGAVPFVVVGLLWLSSPTYVSLLWTTTHGMIVSCAAMCWMAIGIAMMKKMISFDF
jgi:tight adherence protein B